MDEPRIRIVLEVLYRVQTERLAEVVSNSIICSKQQDLYSNKGIAFHIKLWKEVKDGNRYQEKRKGGESNRVCRKNEKDIRGNRGSIKESTRENEEISRQGTKRGERIKTSKSEWNRRV